MTSLRFTSMTTKDMVLDRGLHSAILTSNPSLASIHSGKYACILDLLLSYLLYFITGLGYSLATTTIFFAFALTTVPVNNFPLIERLPWNGQNLSLQDFLGGETEIPIFLAIKYQLIVFV